MESEIEEFNWNLRHVLDVISAYQTKVNQADPTTLQLLEETLDKIGNLIENIDEVSAGQNNDKIIFSIDNSKFKVERLIFCRICQVNFGASRKEYMLHSASDAHNQKLIQCLNKSKDFNGVLPFDSNNNKDHDKPTAKSLISKPQKSKWNENITKVNRMKKSPLTNSLLSLAISEVQEISQKHRMPARSASSIDLASASKSNGSQPQKNNQQSSAAPNENYLSQLKQSNDFNHTKEEQFNKQIQMIASMQSFAELERTMDIDSNEKLSHVISLVFEKAIDEPIFPSAYAQLCHKLSGPMRVQAKRESGERFKKALLSKCQIEFNTHVANENSIREKLKPLYQELNETNDSNRKMELSSQLEEEERKLRRRSVGIVRFIGELYRQNMMHTSIMEWCVMTLLNIRTEEKLECLCELLTTVGQKMEHKTYDEMYDRKYYRDLTPHFLTMQQIASDTNQSKISSRVRIMLMDVIELRRNKWVPRRTDSNPKKMGQIQKEVMEDEYNKQIHMLASMPSSGGMGNNNMRKDNRDRNDRGSMPRGSSMSGSGYNNSNKLNRSYQDNNGWIQQGGNKGRGGCNNNTFDPSKFRTPSNIEDITKLSLATPNQFKWKFNSQSQAATSLTNSFSALEPETYKPLSGNRSKRSTTSLSTSNLPSPSSLTPSSSDPKLSEDISEQTEQVIHSILKNLLQKVQKNEINDYDAMDEAPHLDKINQVDRWALVRDLHNMAADISGLTEAKRRFIGIICTCWLNHNQISKQDYVRGLSEFVTMLADNVIDVPKVYEWTAQMISVAFFNGIITLNELEKMAGESRAKLLGKLLPFMAYEYGPQYVRDLWKRSNCKWEKFDSDAEQFLEQYKLKFVENPKETLPPANEQIPNDRIRLRIRQLIHRGGFSENEVNEYIKIHVPTINKQSIRLLTKTLIEAALNKNNAGYSLDETNLLPRSVNILKEYIGGEQKQDLQLESLYAIQLLSNELEHPSGFLLKVFGQLFDNEVVPENVFKLWEGSADEPLGKEVAVKNLTQFLKFVDDDSNEEDEEDAK